MIADNVAIMLSFMDIIFVRTSGENGSDDGQGDDDGDYG